MTDILTRIAEYVASSRRTTPYACLLFEDAMDEIQRLRNIKACDSCGYVTGTLKKSEVI